MGIANNLKKLREEKGWTQAELAKRARISRIAIGNYERGARTPNIKIALKIAGALDVELDDLLEDAIDLKEELAYCKYELKDCRHFLREPHISNKLREGTLDDIEYYQKKIDELENKIKLQKNNDTKMHNDTVVAHHGFDDEDDELTEYLNELHKRPEMKMLFKVAKKASKEDVEKAVKIIEMFKGNNNSNGDDI